MCADSSSSACTRACGRSPRSWRWLMSYSSANRPGGPHAARLRSKALPPKRVRLAVRWPGPAETHTARTLPRYRPTGGSPAGSGRRIRRAAGPSVPRRSWRGSAGRPRARLPGWPGAAGPRRREHRREPAASAIHTKSPRGPTKMPRSPSASREYSRSTCGGKRPTVGCFAVTCCASCFCDDVEPKAILAQ